jgi:hypothetical protein
MTDPLISKTFLARLCEQAERYDGKIHASDIFGICQD